MKKITKWMGKPISKMDDQYISNVLWFLEVFWSNRNYLDLPLIINHNDALAEELSLRGVTRLKWKPLPIPTEIESLVERGMIRPNGDIVRDEKVIGSITHIVNWTKYLK